MKRLLLSMMMLLCAVSGAARADDLADAAAAWERQDFAKAYQLYTKLANAGNPVAQQMLGEMYGFGEGVAEDRAQAESWLKKAQAGGNQEAAASLAVVAQRAANKAEIARYVSAYDGAELRLERYGCVKPTYPEVSKTAAELNVVKAGETAWYDCYERFIRGIEAVTPVGKAIPPKVAETMSLTELAQARERMNSQYTAIVTDAQQQAAAVIATHDKWALASKSYIEGMDKQNATLAEVRRREVEEMNERYRAVMRGSAGGSIR